MSPGKKAHVFQVGVCLGHTHTIQLVHTHTHAHTQAHTHMQNCPRVAVSKAYGVPGACADRSYMGTLNSETKLNSANTIALK